MGNVVGRMMLFPPLHTHLNNVHVLMMPRTYEYITVNIGKKNFDVVIKIRMLKWEEALVRATRQ